MTRALHLHNQAATSLFIQGPEVSHCLADQAIAEALHPAVRSLIRKHGEVVLYRAGASAIGSPWLKGMG